VVFNEGESFGRKTLNISNFIRGHFTAYPGTLYSSLSFSFFPRCFTFQDLRGVAADADGVEHDVRVVAVRRKLGTQLRLVRKNSGIFSGNGTS
jgi:hypothetical protein